jgi:hypothetical protein
MVSGIWITTETVHGMPAPIRLIISEEPVLIPLLENGFEKDIHQSVFLVFF